MKRRSTRDRILESCRNLFNARGPSAVTTAEIARAVDINEGNLYYHFRRKADIVLALFEAFAAEQEAVAAGDRDLSGWFKLMWKWRFFYRDSGAVFALAPELRQRLREVSDTVQAYGRQRLQGMVAAGRLKASDEEIELLLVNAWIVSAYWIEYLHSRHGITRLTRRHLDWGFRQMEALFTPYLVQDGAAGVAVRG